MQSVDYGGAIGSLQYLSCTTCPDIVRQLDETAGVQCQKLNYNAMTR